MCLRMRDPSLTLRMTSREQSEGRTKDRESYVAKSQRSFTIVQDDKWGARSFANAQDDRKGIMKFRTG